MDNSKTGLFIREMRKEKNMTQEDLARILGVTNKTISRWENGNYMPDLSLLKPLSEVYADIGGESAANAKIRRQLTSIYGGLAGVAQQYLFFHKRETAGR